MPLEDDKRTSTPDSDDQLFVHEEYFFHEPMRYYSAVKCALNAAFTPESLKTFRDFPVYEDDIWLPTFPKTGTTWCQEMLWLIANNVDYKTAENYIFMRFPFLEYMLVRAEHCTVPMPHLTEGTQPSGVIDLGYASKTPRPRYLKSHLPLAFLPTQLLEKKPKIVHVLRDPKDAAVSWYHHHRLLRNYQNTPETFLESFIRGRTVYGNYWAYEEPFWKLRNEPNVLILQFEEMKMDLPASIKKTADFLGKELSELEITQLADHLSFSKMKANRWVNFQWVTDQMKTVNDKTSFIRKGEIGDYRNLMSPEIVRKFDDWNREMKRTLDIEDFPY